MSYGGAFTAMAAEPAGAAELPLGAEATDEAAHVLVVDDNEVNRRLLSSILQGAGYVFEGAADGDSAVRQATETPPDLILLDVMMPGKDGYEVCQELRSLPSTHHVPIIFLSALSETKDKIKALAAGGIDFITKPFDRSEVLARVRAQVEIGRLTRQLLTTNDQLRRDRALLDADLKAAAVIQRALLPTAAPQMDRVRCAWRFTPSESVGGDFFHFLSLDEDQLAIYMLDVSGHGVTSAMVTVCLSQTLSPESGVVIVEEAGVKRLARPAEVLAILEREYPLHRFDRYFTMVYVVLDISRGTLTCACAGHPPPVLLRRDRSIEVLTASGPIIGLGRPVDFQEQTVRVQGGERLFLYTDGITELDRPDGAMYGEDRFYQQLRESKDVDLEQACSRVIDSMHRFAEGQASRDDVSLLALELLAPSCTDTG
jgi:sigma-B regulation protein RsbU (phosphoserine phosphatase)